MKKIIIALFAFVALLAGCTDKELTERVSVLEGKVATLEALCSDLNTNVVSLQAFVSKVKDNLYVETVTAVTDGFTITFTDGTTYTIKNGDKGSKGDKGDKGDTGETGAIGATPLVGLKQHTDGIYYWTINGEWLKVDDKMVSAVGATPQLKVENDKWMVSYNGTTWSEVAPAYDYEKVLTVTEDADAVYIKQQDGTTFTLPKVPGFGFKVSQLKDIVIAAGSTVSIPYTVTAGDETVEFEVRGSAGFTGEVVAEDITKGVVKVTAPSPFTAGYIVVTAIQNSTGESKSQYLSFEKGELSLVTDAATIDAFGGNLTLSVKTNVDFEVQIPEDVDWIAPVVETKAVTVKEAKVFVSENTTTTERTAVIKVVAEGMQPLNFTIVQERPASAPVFEVDKLTDNVAAAGGNVTISVTGNVPWTVTCPEGVTSDVASGTGEGQVVFTIPENTTYAAKTYELALQTSIANAVPSSYTVVITQAGLPSPYDFTYVLWGVDDNNIGNNMGLTPAKDYGNQFRVAVDAKVILKVKESDIPEGATVQYTWVNKSSSGVSIHGTTGDLTIWGQSGVDKTICQVGYVAVKVGGDSEYAVTKNIPVFIDRTGVNKTGYCIEYTPFAIRVNPKKGRTTSAPTIKDANGATPEGFKLDFRRNLFYYNVNGNLGGATEGKMSSGSHYLGYIWDAYYSEIKGTVNYSALNPFVLNYNTSAAKKAAMPVLVDNTDLHVEVRANKFIKDGVPADGILYGTLTGGVVENVLDGAETTPFIIWFDPTFDN